MSYTGIMNSPAQRIAQLGQSAATWAEDRGMGPLVYTAFIKAFGFTKIPMIAFIGPKVRKLTDEESVIEIPLKRRTKNHLGAMYCGVPVT